MSLPKSSFHRRALLGAGLVLPLSGCDQVSSQIGQLFGGQQRKTYTLTPRGDRLVRWLQHEGKDAVMAPEAFALMGLDRGGRDIPVKQLAEEGKDGRYVISLVNFRNVHELVLHRKQGDVLVFHHCDTKFTRFSSVRYPRNGKPAVITDSAVADSDFQQQLTFWFDRMPGR
jgi:hypothetical protein